jgi:hypothetical protein
MSVDSNLSPGEAYAKYCVYKPPPGYVFKYTNDKKWFWYKTQDDQGNLKYSVGSVKSTSPDGVVTLMPIDGAEPVTFSAKELDGYGVNDGAFDGRADCSELTHLSDASVLENIRLRYMVDCIYVGHSVSLGTYCSTDLLWFVLGSHESLHSIPHLYSWYGPNLQRTTSW